MKILICNDDGIESKGLKALAEKFSVDNEVLVIAPDGNRTASSHALSIGKKLKLNKIDNYKNCLAYSLSGTPADCVKFARLYFKDFIPDLVLSGINKGHNLGSDVMYSGTVSIASEAAFFGNISFAFSAYSLGDSNFDKYADYAVEIVKKLFYCSKPGDIWNVNFPNDVNLEIKGVKITSLGKQIYTDRYEKVSDEEYILVGELVDHDKNHDDCDIEWIKKGFITVTPLLLDKTNYKKIDEVKNLCERL